MPRLSSGAQFVKTFRPNNTDPIPLRTSAPKMGTIMVRFVVILFVAVALLALLWSR
jgi:hypothetical protein